MEKKLKVLFDTMKEMTVLEQLEQIIIDLQEAGFEAVDLSTNRTKYKKVVYRKKGCKYVVFICLPKAGGVESKHKNYYACVMDEDIYNIIGKRLNIYLSKHNSNEAPNRQRLVVSGKMKSDDVISYENELLVNIIMKLKNLDMKGKIVDHKYHSPYICTLEAIRLATECQNRINKRNVICDKNSEFAYKKEEDFRDTWFIYIYWRVLGMVSQREVFAYNLENN